MKQVILLILVATLAGCGGVHKARKDARRGQQVSRAPAPVMIAPSAASPAAAIPFARGPLNRACMGSDRKARSRELCGCIQAVADSTMSGSQQRVAVNFYSDPHEAQEIRQSDNSRNEEFWRAYRAYGDAAERICR